MSQCQLRVHARLSFSEFNESLIPMFLAELAKKRTWCGSGAPPYSVGLGAALIRKFHNA